MAVTRIKNNQITDASNGNTQLGVNAAVKLQNYTVTSTKIANNLVYGSDLTVTGNLTVQGNTTTIDTTITTIEDPVIVLASTQTTGTPTVDIGYLGYRGNQSNIAFVWDESASEFITAFTSTGETNTTISISSYANFHTNDANVAGNLTIGGNIDITGNITSLNVTGNITGGNLLTPGLVSATGNITGGNIATAGEVSATSNITGGNLLTGGLISATSSITSAANVIGGNITTVGLITATGNITGGNIDTAGIISATGNITGGNIDTSGEISVTGTITSNANITGGNLTTGGQVSASGDISGNNLYGAGVVSTVGNITGGNIDTAGIISATGNITGGNIDTIGNVSANNIIANSGFFGNLDLTGDVTVNSITSNTFVSATGNVIGGNVTTAGLITATGNITGGNIDTAGLITATGNVTGGNITTTGEVSATGNLLGGNVSTTGNVTGGNIDTAGLITATGNITGGNIDTAGVITATGNVTGGNILTGGLISATSTITSAANVIGGNITTTGEVSATGNVIGGNVTTAGLITATGNVTGGNITTAGLITASGNITGGNIDTIGQVSATGNVYGGNIVSNTITNTSGDVTISAAADLILEPVGNIVLDGGKWINQLNDPVQAQDAATKQYVDDAVSSGITIHTPVYLEANTAVGGTYAQGGTTATVTDTIAGNTVVFSTTVNLQPNDQLWFSNSFEGIQANVAYFVVSAPNTSSAVLSTTYSGAPVSNITSNTGLTQSVRINSGIGATLTNNGANVTLVVDGVTTSNGQRILIYSEANAVHNGVYVVSEAGNATTAWQLTRSTDTDVYGPKSTDELDVGDYFYVQSGDSGAGESYVMTAPVGPFIIGYNNLTFTQFSASQVYTANTNAGLSLIGTVFSAKVDNNTTAFDLGGNIIVKAGANLTTPNIGDATGTTLSLTGNVTSGNVLTGGFVSATGNVTGGNIDTAGVITATGNVTGGNILTGGLISATSTITSAANVIGGNITTTGEVSATGNVIGGNVTTVGLISATGNVTGGNIDTAGLITATGNVTGGNITTGGEVSATGNVTGGNIDTTGNVTGGNLLTGGEISATSTITSNANIVGGNITTVGLITATGNITGGNIDTAGIISATGNITGGNIDTTGNVTGGNIDTAGLITATGNVTGGNLLTGGLISATGNVTGGNILFGSGIVSGTGNIYADTIFANISGNIDAAGNINEVQFNGTGDLLAASAGFTFDPSGNVLTANGNVNGANLFTGGSVSATSNITGGNLLTGGLISATSTITSNANITGGNIDTAGIISATGNITGGNIDTAGIISATGNITGGNIDTAGEVVATGNITGGNLILTGAALDTTAGQLTVNSTSSDADFAVNGNTVANVFYIDAGTDTASFGSSTQTTNAIVAFNATNSILLPVGNIIQRPGTGVTGMLRFNTTNNNLEIYDNSQWSAVGVPSFTVIDDEQFTGDGSTVAFTLNTAQTTNSCIVSINGVVQIPTLAYSVSTTTLTFTEAPAAGDLIDVRQITTTTTITALENGSTAVSLTANGPVNITGDLNPTANITYSLGNTTNRWANLWVGGNTIHLGNLQLKENPANTFAVYLADGITQANIDVGNIDVSAITSGTSAIGIYGTGQAYINVNGNANVLLASNTSVLVNGAFSATGNITGGNLSAGTGTVTVGNIVNANANGVGNIGSSSTYFDTVFAKATSAQYADLAEKYTADADYAPGTVVEFGGDQEITLCATDACSRVAGVISTNPSYIMNGTLGASYVATVALTGRVPTNVTGAVRKGDLMVSAGNGKARAEADPRVGTVIGKALADFDGETGVIEVVVGRF